MIWFTADTHFNHENIIDYCSRPFEDLTDMTTSIVRRWNNEVCRGDTVYHLGDFALSWGKKHAKLIDHILSQLNGNKWLIVGNHDRDEVIKNKRWGGVTHYHQLKIDVGGTHKQRIVLCHYAMRVWNQMHRGAWMLHGHSHGSLTDIGGKTMDVGVDSHGFRPISLHEVADYMNGREVVSVDHHHQSDV
jgi:calcineurin-like phosphoesterase family protein